MTGAASPVDWERAEQVATLIASRRPAPLGDVAGWDPPMELIEQQIEDVTGLRSAAGTATAQLIDRPTWIHANIESFRALLQPVFEKLEAKRPTGGTANAMNSVSRQIAGAQLGTLLGWMSTRVLGQYDLLVGRDGKGDGAVYLVAANLATVEDKFGFDPTSFRTWVLVHELTHRAQFTGVPWMRGYFTGMVDAAINAVDPDPQVILAALKDALHNRAEARQQVRDSGVAGLIASPEQREVIARIGGLMSLLEGHGDVTMTRAAGELVPDAERFARVLSERRRRGNPLSRLVLRLTGMEGKLNQYAAGERFIAAVEAVGGPRMIDICWESQEQLPSLDEIRTPELWLQRVGERVA
ncbi:MAG: zinc-dependent metalloprotease [Ilumatobacteraceae bacterium]